MNDKQLRIIPDPDDPTYQLWIFMGKAILRLDAKAAREAAKLSLGLAGRQEAWENPHKIIQQDALLARTGAPFALTDGALRKEALKEAQWGDARKQMPMNETRAMGAESASKVGLPSLRQWRTN